MRQRLLPDGLLPSGLLTFTLLLGGCALPVEPTEPEPVLGPDEFATRIEGLEQNLAARCELQTAKADEQLLQQAQLNADVREIGSLLRHLRNDIERHERDEPPQNVVVNECQNVDSELANKTVLGRSEWVGLPDVGTYLKARVDSGANTSSLSAREITRFERDGENWVRFKLSLNEDDVVVDEIREEWIEAPIERRVRVIQVAGEDSRPVVSLMMTLGPIQEPVEFTLTDRVHLDYPVLLGRRFLMDIAIIDVAESYRHERPEFPGGNPAEDAELDENDEPDDASEE
ncbi:ATP-dependent zinc protease [Halomonas urumqiensis]|uniref:ATP-dependent zinc protease n=1 Tax=Halomonas urumqiensis TaxID=1684789 RepID=A0A2N7UES6_9GAMM|nr:ATP-dependent zinc protease [Halomonas urumqiensis]PMR78920.1 ATP-dependent zinc protease [Halomonas urumqiensis]PTB04175.1 ATP-dependent zinc protease [Halomonas urumqiensis]GHE19554.1 ATP-dependent Zn protease [Halomonas urumqiensis]